jgi:XTP/dITP diphosphohydrolase
MNTYSSSIHRLQTIVQELRVKCPWDQKQTIHTLRSLSIEELYELADAIDKEDWIGIKEELGDLLLHLLFYAQIAEEAQQFTFADVIETICNKLVKRHPHVYSM